MGPVAHFLTISVAASNIQERQINPEDDESSTEINFNTCVVGWVNSAWSLSNRSPVFI